MEYLIDVTKKYSRTCTFRRTGAHGWLQFLFCYFFFFKVISRLFRLSAGFQSSSHFFGSLATLSTTSSRSAPLYL